LFHTERDFCPSIPVAPTHFAQAHAGVGLVIDRHLVLGGVYDLHFVPGITGGRTLHHMSNLITAALVHSVHGQYHWLTYFLFLLASLPAEPTSFSALIFVKLKEVGVVAVACNILTEIGYIFAIRCC